MSDSDGLPKEVRQFTKDTAEGITKGVLDWGEKKIKAFAKSFFKGKLYFIEDEETLDLVKKQLNSAEWVFFQKIIKDKKLRTLIQSGLGLRQLDTELKKKEVENFRKNIKSAHGLSGLHIAEFIQCKLLIECIGDLFENAETKKELCSHVENLLNSLETRCSFIQKDARDDFETVLILTRLKSNQPSFYVVFSRDSVLNIGKKVEKRLKKKLIPLNYDMKKKESKSSLILILSKKRNLLPSL